MKLIECLDKLSVNGIRTPENEAILQKNKPWEDVSLLEELTNGLITLNKAGILSNETRAMLETYADGFKKVFLSGMFVMYDYNSEKLADFFKLLVDTNLWSLDNARIVLANPSTLALIMEDYTTSQNLFFLPKRLHKAGILNQDTFEQLFSNIYQLTKNINPLTFQYLPDHLLTMEVWNEIVVRSKNSNPKQSISEYLTQLRSAPVTIVEQRSEALVNPARVIAASFSVAPSSATNSADVDSGLVRHNSL